MLPKYAEEKNIIIQTSNYGYLAVFEEEEQEYKTSILIFFFFFEGLYF